MDIAVLELKERIQDLIAEAKGEWEPINERKAIKAKLCEALSLLEKRLTSINFKHLTVGDKKILELAVSFDEDGWWREEDDFDDEAEYGNMDVDQYVDSAPRGWCILCEGWEFIGNPNELEHADDCPVSRLGMLLYNIDFDKIGYVRGGVKISK